jgi:hypothetical protein
VNLQVERPNDVNERRSVGEKADKVQKQNDQFRRVESVHREIVKLFKL